MLETVSGTVRRLSKISNCAFECDYYYHFIITKPSSTLSQSTELWAVFSRNVYFSALLSLCIPVPCVSGSSSLPLSLLIPVQSLPSDVAGRLPEGGAVRLTVMSTVHSIMYQQRTGLTDQGHLSKTARDANNTDTHCSSI